MPFHSAYFDANVSDAVRRQRLYDGQVFIYSPRPSTLELCNLAREMIEEAFGKVDPRQAQHHMPVEKYVEICAPLKPKFIHHPQSKQCIREMLSEVGCDLSKTYFDVPRMRIADDVDLVFLRGPLRLSRTKEGILVQGDLELGIEDECYRCLRPIERHLQLSIEELYAWEFDGPQLRDFTGRKPTGARNVGAIAVAP